MSTPPVVVVPEVVVSSVVVPSVVDGAWAAEPPLEPPLAASATPTLKATTIAGTSKSFVMVDMSPSFVVSVMHHRG
jgi:hypothetical protein